MEHLPRPQDVHQNYKANLRTLLWILDFIQISQLYCSVFLCCEIFSRILHCVWFSCINILVSSSLLRSKLLSLFHDLNFWGVPVRCSAGCPPVVVLMFFTWGSWGDASQEEDLRWSIFLISQPPGSQMVLTLITQQKVATARSLHCRATIFLLFLFLGSLGGEKWDIKLHFLNGVVLTYVIWVSFVRKICFFLPLIPFVKIISQHLNSFLQDGWRHAPWVGTCLEV